MNKKILGGLLSLGTAIACITPIYASRSEILKEVEQTTTGTAIGKTTLASGQQEGMIYDLPSILTEFFSKFVVPVLILIAIIVAITGTWQLLFAEDSKSVKKGVAYLTWGTIGFVIITAASFISGSFNTILGAKLASDTQALAVPQAIFDQIVAPFLSLALYIVPGILVILLIINAFTLLTNTGEDAQKKATTMITWTIIGTLIIIGAKFMIDQVYGLGGTAQFKNTVEDNEGLLFVHNIIKWVLGFVGFALLIIIIAQTVQVFSKPTDSSTFDKLKKSITYMLIGLIIVTLAYIISNFIIFK